MLKPLYVHDLKTYVFYWRVHCSQAIPVLVKYIVGDLAARIDLDCPLVESDAVLPIFQLLPGHGYRQDDCAAGEQGKQQLEASGKLASEELVKARARAAEIIAHAEKRGLQMVEEAKSAAKADSGGAKTDSAKSEGAKPATTATKSAPASKKAT